MKHDYETRAPEYDDRYLGLGRFAKRGRPYWHEDVRALEQAIAAELPRAVVLHASRWFVMVSSQLRA